MGATGAAKSSGKGGGSKGQSSASTSSAKHMSRDNRWEDWTEADRAAFLTHVGEKVCFEVVGRRVLCVPVPCLCYFFYWHVVLFVFSVMPMNKPADDTSGSILLDGNSEKHIVTVTVPEHTTLFGHES